jgi:signal transduction histidine kinase/ligand-binding sensor domain-containing protein
MTEGIVYAIHQDRQGLLWIGTHGGLNVFDGYGFTNFHYKPFDSTSLGENPVFFLKEDPVSGRFWIGGSATLNEFDPKTRLNKRYKPKEHLEFADGMFINDRELLLACENAVVLFDTRSKHFAHVPVYNNDGSRTTVSRVENLASDRKGNLMVMTRSGIFFFDRATQSCKRKTSTSPDLSAFDDHQVFNVYQDRSNRYWIGTNTGLFSFNAITNVIREVVFKSGRRSTVRIDMIAEESNGEIWAGSSEGLLRVALPAYEYDTVLFESIEVNYLFEDRDNILWAGTVSEGLKKLLRPASGFQNFHLATAGTQRRTGTYIMGIQKVNDDIWFMNIWDEIGRVNERSGKVQMIGKPVLPREYSWYSEGTIVKTASQELTILNTEHSIQVTAGSKLKFDVRKTPGLSYIFQSPSSLRTYYMVRAAVPETFVRNDTIFGNHFFFDATEDASGNIWIGTSSGLVCIAAKDHTVSQYRHDPTKAGSIASDYIYSLEIDTKSQKLWLATYDGGVSCFDMLTGTATNFNRENGLAGNMAYAVERDRSGNFWFSTNSGITKYNNKDGTFTNFGVEDGLLNHEFNRRSSFQDEHGRIYFGGAVGIDYFDPDSITKTATIPRLFFTGFRIFNSEVVPDTINAFPAIHLDHYKRYITISYSAPNFRNQQKVRYAYRINESEWIQAGTRNSLSFSDLTTGTHRLAIRCTDTEGKWQESSLTCLLVVHPAWWQSTEFQAVMLIAMLIVVAAGISYYYRTKLSAERRELEKQKLIEKERTRIATDMHDDLGSGLSRIRYLSEMIGMKKERQQPIEQEVGKIREYSQEMIGKMSEIVWALNEKNDTLTDLVSFTRAYALEYLHQHDIACEATVIADESDRFVSGEFRRNIFLAVKEALHNVVKHSGADFVRLEIRSDEKLLQIRISDNGRGFDPSAVSRFANGVTGIRRRMNELGGKAIFEISNGTSLELEAPLPG